MISLDFFIEVICIFFCGIQLYILTSSYFQYDVRNEILLLRPRFIELPFVSFCSGIGDSMDLNQLYLMSKDSIDLALKSKPYLKPFHKLDESLRGELFNEYINYMTMIISTISLDKIKKVYKLPSITPIYTVNQNVTGIDFNIDLPISYSFKLPLELCGTVNHPYTSYEYSEVRVFGNLSGMLDSVSVNLHPQAFRTFYVHPHGTTPRRNLNWIFLKKFEEDVRIDITYQRFIMRRLPAPYKTRCIDYSKIGFESRMHALDDCAVRESVKLMKSLCCNVQILVNDTRLENITIWPNMSFKEKRSIESRLIRNCYAKYDSYDCKHTAYHPRILQEVPSEYNRTFVNVFAPLDQDMVSITHPKIYLGTYMIQLGSIVAFWFGISIVGLGKGLKRVACKLIGHVYMNRCFIINNQNNFIIQSHPSKVYKVNIKPNE